MPTTLYAYTVSSFGWKDFHEHLDLLSNLHFHYATSTTTGKQAFIKLVFEQNLTYAEGAFRTNFLPSLFSSKAATLAERGLLYVDKKTRLLDNNLVSSPDKNRTCI
ncbi:MAG TPA: hypothetical protein VL098_00480 [Flavipsychrobacter sp.]|nr:hypothetical protein [Flavipsychrobacter sp.]